METGHFTIYYNTICHRDMTNFEISAKRFETRKTKQSLRLKAVSFGCAHLIVSFTIEHDIRRAWKQKYRTLEKQENIL